MQLHKRSHEAVPQPVKRRLQLLFVAQAWRTPDMPSSSSDAIYHSMPPAPPRCPCIWPQAPRLKYHGPSTASTHSCHSTQGSVRCACTCHASGSRTSLQPPRSPTAARLVPSSGASHMQRLAKRARRTACAAGMHGRRGRYGAGLGSVQSATVPIQPGSTGNDLCRQRYSSSVCTMQR